MYIFDSVSYSSHTPLFFGPFLGANGFLGLLPHVFGHVLNLVHSLFLHELS